MISKVCRRGGRGRKRGGGERGGGRGEAVERRRQFLHTERGVIRGERSDGNVRLTSLSVD